MKQQETVLLFNYGSQDNYCITKREISMRLQKIIFPASQMSHKDFRMYRIWIQPPVQSETYNLPSVSLIKLLCLALPRYMILQSSMFAECDLQGAKKHKKLRATQTPGRDYLSDT